MKESYAIPCPICSDKVEVTIGDGRVIYYIEGHKKKSKFRTLINSKDPAEVRGRNLMLNDSWVQVEQKKCEEKHYVDIYHSHYTNIEDTVDYLYGPTEEPDVHCPNKSCQAKLDPHSKHIIRLDKSMDLQFVLRTVSLSEPDNYTLVEAITGSTGRNHNQITVRNECPHCRSSVYFNYNSRKINEEENYKGIKKNL